MKRKVVSEPSLRPEQEEGIVALYQALVPENEWLEINIPMIVNEGFKSFEETIGISERDIENIKNYFGISDSKKKVSKNMIFSLLNKLRTIENAMNYISGYKNLIENIASKMKGAPRDMPEIVKAKLLIMYFLFFCQSYFFPDEFTMTMQGRTAINKCEVEKKRNTSIYPEYMFVLYMNLINRHAENSMVYDMIVHELSMLGSNLQNEILGFVELKKAGDSFVSINKANADVSFSYARGLKKLINPIPMVIETDKLSDVNNIKLFRFQPMYEIYKLLTTRALESFEKKKIQKVFFEKNVIFLKELEVYEIIENFEVSSQREAERIIFMFEYVARHGFTMKAKEVPKGDEEAKDFDCVIGNHIAAFNFAKKEGYLREDSSLEEDLDVANNIIERADEKFWMEYLNNRISHEQLKSILKIDKEFEKNVLGFVRKETPLETIVRFATEAGYLTKDNLPDEKLIQEVIVANNENVISKFAAGEITEENFKKKIGFDESFAEMYFNPKSIEIGEIETKLLELKKSRASKSEIRKVALLVNLYCYIIQNNVKCGPKGKPVKRNKSLKPQNLLAMIA